MVKGIVVGFVDFGRYVDFFLLDLIGFYWYFIKVKCGGNLGIGEVCVNCVCLILDCGFKFVFNFEKVLSMFVLMFLYFF